jgi:hypothetical protein
MELESFLFITTEFKTSPDLTSEEFSPQTGMDKLFWTGKFKFVSYSCVEVSTESCSESEFVLFLSLLRAYEQIHTQKWEQSIRYDIVHWAFYGVISNVKPI